MVLRHATAADLDQLRFWFNDPHQLVQWGGSELRYPLDAPQLAHMLADGNGDRPRRWLFSGLAGDDVEAHAQVMLDWQHGVARLCRVAVVPARRRQGVATSFVRGVIERIFAFDGFERVELHVSTFDIGAIRTYRQLGFVEEGIRRSSIRIGDRRCDTAIFGLLRSDLRRA